MKRAAELLGWLHIVTAVLLLIPIQISAVAGIINGEFSEKLAHAINVTQQTIDDIYFTWQINKYPYFLKSCFMHKNSWELLKLKFQRKIMSAALSKEKTSNFSIAFTGSSVTAGHDSLFNASYPVVLGELMVPVLNLLDVQLDSRNVALGNNPCTPYDICAKYFTGFDADIIHWEQTFFCRGAPVIEQFVRQSYFMPSRPIVVFAESETAHWPEKDCTSTADTVTATEHSLTDDERGLLAANPLQIVSELNRDDFHKTWGNFGEYTRLYHSAGIQTFQHSREAAYKCQGPYIPTWAKGAAPWHPSVIAHRLRASHHAYFWLLIWRDAVMELQSLASHRQADAIDKDIDHHLQKLYGQPLGAAHHPSAFPDNAQCFTDYEPRSVRNVSLRSVIITGIKTTPDSVGWRFSIYEDLVSHSLVEKSLKMGYLDFKYMLYGDEAAGPLSLSVLTIVAGPLFICETPGIWGSLPKGFDHLWTEGVVKVYVTYNVQDKPGFKFNKEKAFLYHVHHEKSLEICAKITPNATSDDMPAGAHVVTIIPQTSKKIIAAWLITAQ